MIQDQPNQFCLYDDIVCTVKKKLKLTLEAQLFFLFYFFLHRATINKKFNVYVCVIYLLLFDVFS